MDEREFEDMLRRVLQQDFSAGTEGFRDALLDRCLAELDAGGRVIELDDGDLEMLAAAGEALPVEARRTLGDNESD